MPLLSLKMDKKFKINLAIVLIFITLIIIGANMVFRFLGGAFSPTCEKSEHWSIAEYKIQRYQCLGWAGPYYYPACLIKNGKIIDENKYIRDSCFFKFRPKEDLYLNFNICNKSLTEIQANKQKLDIEKISRIYIKDLNSGLTKNLERKAIKKFINDWNRSKISDHCERDPIFYPAIRFELYVSSEGDEIKFNGFKNLIADESNWVYYIHKNDSTYFDQLMNFK